MASLLDGMANTGMVELREGRLVTYLFEKTFTGQPSFQNGLPSLIAFPSGCNTTNCLIGYEGELYVDAVTNWFATISLHCILYYSKDSMVYSDLGLFNECRQWQLTLRNAVNREKGQREEDDEDRPNRRRKKRAVSNQDRPPSVTDTKPKDAYQMPLSDFD
ncbi:unnamed protein product [Camellia sinensis]